MRRETAVFVALSIATAACAAQSPKPGAMSSSESKASRQSHELLPDEQIQQVLNRLAFGARPGDAEKVRSLGVERWIDLQLQPEKIDDSKTDALVAQYTVFGMKTSDIVRDYNVQQQLQRQLKRAEANDSSMSRAQTRQEMIAQNPQLAE